jgi:hypothetical protein
VKKRGFSIQLHNFSSPLLPVFLVTIQKAKRRNRSFPDTYLFVFGGNHFALRAKIGSLRGSVPLLVINGCKSFYFVGSGTNLVMLPYYLYVGPLEYAKYPKVNLRRFSTFMQVIYTAEGVTIYRIKK